MKKSKPRSEVALSAKSSRLVRDVTEYIPPMDSLVVKLMSLRLADETSTKFAVKITFFNQPVLSGIIKSVEALAQERDHAVIKGSFSYDPSDYGRMCLFADTPLVVQIQPLKEVERSVSRMASQSMSFTKSTSFVKSPANISCCNIDILRVFLDQDKICVRKRMEPMIEPKALQQKSWDNLPLITLEVSVKKNPLNMIHHELLKDANHMKLTVVASYNMIEPYSNEFFYTAATRMPFHDETNTSVMTFTRGHRISRKFQATSFYPQWENLRQNEDVFTRSDDKFAYELCELQNLQDIDLHYYMDKLPRCYTTVWGSFHRTLLLRKDAWLWNQLRAYKWPIEVHMTPVVEPLIKSEWRSYHCMGHLSLLKLLYPGETTVCLAVPLLWTNSHTMSAECGCNLLMPVAETTASAPASQKPAKTVIYSKESGILSASTDTDSVFFRSTGADGSAAFVIVEVSLARPLRKPFIPPHIPNLSISEMLAALEAGFQKRECTGRGQLDREWLSTLKTAVASLRKVPHYGMTEFCLFNRQLSETRTRVELLTSFTNDAAVYVNNNFVVQEYLRSDDLFEELLLMAHACLMRITCQMLVEVNAQDIDPALRAARHARQMQDHTHAKLLFMQAVVQKPRDSDNWRELATCLLDINKDWGEVCLTKSLQLNMRNPLNILSKGCMVFDKDPAAAEIFFGAILSLYPFWTTGWVIISAYYFEQQMYHMADQIKVTMKKTRSEGFTSIIGYPRTWGYELGDWWEPTTLLPGMSAHYDAADLLLRLRAFSLAEVCLARALTEVGETAVYYHLVALCCRLRGNLDEALCHIRKGLDKFGEINYLRALEAECLHKSGDLSGAAASFEKAGSSVGAYCTLLGLPTNDLQRTRSILVDFIRRQPNAYAWMALADDWMTRAAMGEGGDADITDEQTSAKTCAVACAVQALKWDRRAGRAWALLSRLVTPSARRLHCREMAKLCGYVFEDAKKEFYSPSQQSLCHRLGTALRECRCRRCSYRYSVLKL